MNPRDKDHVTVHSIEGFVTNDLFGAFAETEAISDATKCQKYLFSLSLNPPPSENVSVEQFEDAIAKAEKKLGLEGSPRVVVVHRKEGRQQAHAINEQPGRLCSRTKKHGANRNNQLECRAMKARFLR